MITVDVVMPFGGYRGGIENVMYEWSRGLPDDEFNLRFFNVSPGLSDYLKGYKNQWTLPMPKEKMDRLTVEYIAGAYAFFIDNQGAPDICIANWVPICSKACVIARESKKMSFPVLSYMHTKIAIYESLGYGTVKDMAFADAHICISKAVENEILAVIPNALTLMVGNPLKRVNIDGYDPDEFTLCYAGRLGAEKKVETIITALSKTKDRRWNILIAGDGVAKDGLVKLTDELGLNGRVSFLGWMEEPWEALKKAKYCVLSSEYEGWNAMVREASSIGMTVISTPVGGVVDYLMPGQNGYLYPVGSSDDLAIILDNLAEGKLPACNPEVCKKSVEGCYTDKYFENIKNIFRTITSEDLKTG